ncbi:MULTISPECIES: nucleoside-triphosphatase [unclassified Enterococcus]|uniref:nucleoside-triphosphatase n=1 Tax=unclassified Enterococcus TaxID=2608891 RepID=UPI001CE20A6A|nr:MULTISPECIES: nucleoside-triphosphatase [unclassified Enterococcus]MCA5011895.1 hypothetical protein [Enterococcus sp. S23]MCA5014663.1 hypothetical protein [Enterococcus sp. S22(2020)]
MRHFFLQGDKFIGKSTMLQKVLQEMAIPVGGFYVERRWDALGNITGFELRAAMELSTSVKLSQSNEDHYFIYTKDGKRYHNLTVFEEFGCELLRKARRSEQVILLDEIGGIELLSDKFTKELLTTIQRSKKILGVFKSEKNYQNQKQHTLEKLEISHQRELLKQEIIKANGKIMSLTRENQHSLEAKLRLFLKE